VKLGPIREFFRATIYCGAPQARVDIMPGSFGHMSCDWDLKQPAVPGVCPMIKLDAGNVLLKPSHRRQLMAWLRRAIQLGSRLGQFALTIRMRRTGRQYEVRAMVHDSAGDFVCRSRQTDWRSAVRDLVHSVVQRLHQQWVMRDAVIA
jgi:hypothetical protein